jgi:hypothetical protein
VGHFGFIKQLQFQILNSVGVPALLEIVAFSVASSKEIISGGPNEL